MKTYILFIAFILLGSIFVSAQDWKGYKFESGDILFQDVDCGALCDAIEMAGPARSDKRFSHVGIAYVVQDAIWVIEAYKDNVHLVMLDSFMKRQTTVNGNPKVMVGRLSAEYQNLAGRAVGFALEQRGRAYDNTYTYDNGIYYASELVFDAYKAANGGLALLELTTANFNDPKTNKLLPFWEEHFKGLQMKVPDGATVFTPGGIANDENVEIITSFYR